MSLSEFDEGLNLLSAKLGIFLIPSKQRWRDQGRKKRAIARERTRGKSEGILGSVLFVYSPLSSCEDSIIENCFSLIYI